MRSSLDVVPCLHHVGAFSCHFTAQVRVRGHDIWCIGHNALEKGEKGTEKGEKGIEKGEKGTEKERVGELVRVLVATSCSCWESELDSSHIKE